MNRLFKLAVIVCVSAAVGLAARAQTNVLVWHKDAGTVDAAMRHEPLLPLLKSIAAQSGWHVYVEPGSTLDSSTQFKNRPTGDALKMLLGDLNFALVPETDSPWRLYVFRTTMKNATQSVSAKPKHVPNELLVKVKPGTDIDALAKSLGAKVIGRLDKSGIYLLQFSNENSTDNALAQLQMDSDVQSVGYNNYYDPPPNPQALASGASPQIPTTLTPASPSGRTVIGLVDTAVDPNSLGPNASQFLLPEVNIAGGTGTDSGPTHGDSMAALMLEAGGNTLQSSQIPFQIQSYNVYESGEQTTSYDVLQGAMQAVANQNNPINLSLGSSDPDPVLDAYLAGEAQQGFVFFSAAGNAYTGDPYYPAAVQGVYAITALGQPGQLASYANYWYDPGMMALPGTGAFNFGGQSWMVEGTSASTAEASAIYAANYAQLEANNPVASPNIQRLDPIHIQTQVIHAMQMKFVVPIH
ncbi:MAG TPA: S8 family serine peptidase [Verrucomicrobiae bacterium]|nr:S8 family serine peptidase [Verrucomicrobiae bacterium]